jgi:hypothetical protein
MKSTQIDHLVIVSYHAWGIIYSTNFQNIYVHIIPQIADHKL